MIRREFKVNFSLIIATYIVIGLANFIRTEYLPPNYGENSNTETSETKPRLGSGATNGRANINYRLPNNTEPIHYNVDITTNVHNGTREFTGRVQILLTATEDTRTIVVHALRLGGFLATIKSADETNAAEYAMNWSYEQEREFLSLTPQDTNINFNKGTNWTLTIAYIGEINTYGAGFYMPTYKDSMNKIHYMAITQFEATNARLAFPCYDEPAKRATFTVTIRHHPSYKALSNMPKNESASSNGVTIFNKTNVSVPTYLIAFHVSDYEGTKGSINSIPHQLYSKPEGVSLHEFTLLTGILVLQHLSDYYNVSYALPRMVQLAIPDKRGATENWGLVTYDEKYLLYNRTTATKSSQMTDANIIAHEFTHQWFGNHVAVKWWTYLWLKEGFATLFSYEVVDELFPEWDVYQTMHTNQYQSALINDGRGTVAPMTHYAQTPSEIAARYDISSYAKPACVLHMWQHALGRKVFRSSLNKYLTDNAFSSTEEWHLFAAIQSAVDEHKLPIPAIIEVMFPTWSQQSGYPLLTVLRNYTSKTFTVTQTAYNENKTNMSSKKYYIPLNYATTSRADFRNTTATHYLLNTKEIVIADNELDGDDWLILNKQSTSYYRINYDDKNWNLIVQGLIDRPNRIHPRNRAQILYDAYTFVSTNRLPHSILLELMAYLPGEDQYAPWYAAYTILTTYNAYLNGDSDYSEFKQYVALLVSNIYEKLGVNEVPGEQLLRKITRNRAVNLACLVSVENCLSDANNKLKALINNGVAIEPNLSEQAYCNGLRKSSDNDYNYFLNDFLNSKDTSYRSYLLSALGCSQNATQLLKFLSSSINLSNSLTDEDRTSILSNTYSKSAEGLLVSIDFLNDNWKEYGKLYVYTDNTNPLSKDVVGMANYVNNIEQKKKILDLVDTIKTSSMAEPNLENKVRANMKVNFDWLDKNREPIISYVKRHRSNESTTLRTASFCVLMTLTLILSSFL
ncbi:aminopeptidase N-like [Eurosta solidaginis]|uniref:aminopeptidase N-like n=1 Tax=Eurosta solidaginis TaxID=178769 RepID=UPI003530593C